MAELTPADVFAMTGGRNGNNCNDFLEGNGIIILILFFLMFSGNWGGGFGGGANWGAASQGMFTRAEMYEGFNNQNTVNTLNNLGTAINNGFSGVQMGLCNGFNGVQASIANMGFNMQQCCCDLKTTIHSESESIKALMTKNEIDSLRQQLQDEKNERLATGIVTANNIQTRTLEDFILANAAPAATA